MKKLIILLLLPVSCFAFSKTEAVAAVLVGEATAEGVEMLAVANVIQNRGNQFKSAFVVVSEGWQFSAVNTVVVFKSQTWEQFILKAKRNPGWYNAIYFAQRLEERNLIDITGGATHYYAYRIMNKPYWASSMRNTVTIGGHKFYRK